MARPTGPAPTMTTRAFCSAAAGAGVVPNLLVNGDFGSIGHPVLPSALQRGPDFAVALGRPDPRMLDAIIFVPETLHIERQAVLEDRPGAELRSERGVGCLEGLLERAAGLVDVADILDHAVEELAGLLDCSVGFCNAAGDGATAAERGFRSGKP